MQTKVPSNIIAQMFKKNCLWPKKWSKVDGPPQSNTQPSTGSTCSLFQVSNPTPPQCTLFSLLTTYCIYVVLCTKNIFHFCMTNFPTSFCGLELNCMFLLKKR